MPHALILGASRGIGAEFVRQYRAEGWQVTATARSEPALKALGDMGAQAIALDVASAESTSRLAWQIDGLAFDVADSVADMRRVLGSLTAAHNGAFINHDGEPLPW